MPDARSLFAPLPARYDLLAELLSFYQNERWRSFMVGRVPSTAGRVLDVAAGTAGVTLALARQCPSAQVVGIDLTEQMLREGARRVASAGLGPRVAMTIGQAERLPFPDASFDALTFTYLLRYVSAPSEVLAELARVVKPGGVMASLEFAVPSGPVWWPLWWMYTRSVLPAGGLVTGGPAWWRVGRFLGPSISGHYQRYPVDWTVSAWQAAGLTGVRCHSMSLGGGLIMWGTRGG